MKESKENDLVILPDLYIRKLRIIEKVHNLRRSYLPRQNHIAPNINLKDERQFTQWDYVLQEIKWMAYDFKHERKYKIAVAYHCSRRIMKQHKQEEVYNKELILYHKLVSHEMAEMVRSEFQNLNKETKEIEIERIPLENELSNAQNDVDVLDLDMELKEKPISSLTPNNLSALQSNFNNNTTSNLKKHATSIQLSTFSIPSSKIKKKGNNNLHKTSVFPAPVIKKQPLLIEFMKRTVECIGIQPLEQCCQVEKAQFYEKLAKLFKRFPKKTQHLKSNVPDIFTNSGNIPQTTPIISSFEDNLKGTPNSWNPVIENSGHKKRKKTTFKEEGLRGGSKFQMGELKKGLDFLNFKKLKNPENFDEILTMFYNDHKIGEGDYQKIFQNSVSFNFNLQTFLILNKLKS